MQSKRWGLEQYKLSHNEFPKMEDIPKNIFDDFITTLEAEIREYYIKQENIKEKNKK